MKASIRVIDNEKYVPVSKKTAKVLQETGIQLYKIGNLKTLFIKVNPNKENI